MSEDTIICPNSPWKKGHQYNQMTHKCIYCNKTEEEVKQIAQEELREEDRARKIKDFKEEYPEAKATGKVFGTPLSMKREEKEKPSFDLKGAFTGRTLNGVIEAAKVTPLTSFTDEKELKEIEAKHLKGEEIEVYRGNELINKVPREIAVKAIEAGDARLLNPNAIQQIERTAEEQEKINRERERQARFGEMQKQRAKDMGLEELFFKGDLAERAYSGYELIILGLIRDEDEAIEHYERAVEDAMKLRVVEGKVIAEYNDIIIPQLREILSEEKQHRVELKRILGVPE